MTDIDPLEPGLTGRIIWQVCSTFGYSSCLLWAKLFGIILIAEKHQVMMITSYASFRQDIERIWPSDFYVIRFLDEAQVMKNDRTKIAQHLRSFEVRKTLSPYLGRSENHMGGYCGLFS